MCENAPSTAHQGSSSEIHSLEFLLKFGYVGVIDWSIAHVVELDLQAFSSPEVKLISRGSKPQSSNHMICFLAWAAPTQVSSLTYTVGCDLRSPLWIAKALLSLGKL